MSLQATTVSFESIQVGDQLPSLEKKETQETIDAYLELSPSPKSRATANLHTDKEFAETGIFTGMVNYGVTTCAYMVELLQMAFPTRSILSGTFSMRALEPIRVDDVVTYTGKVLDKRQEDGKRLVEVEVTGTNQMDQTVAVAKAIIPL